MITPWLYQPQLWTLALACIALCIIQGFSFFTGFCTKTTVIYMTVAMGNPKP